MTREQAKDFIVNQEPTFLSKAKKKGYICPKCGNGSGTSGDGITRNPKASGHTHYKCQVCGGHWDIIELAGLHRGVDDVADNFKWLYEYFNITIDDIPDKTPEKRTKQPQEQAPETAPEDYTAFIEEAFKNNDFLYLQERGISKETQQHFKVGYVKSWAHPKAIETLKAKGVDNFDYIKSPRCIIPTSKNSCIARDTRKELPDTAKDYAKIKLGETQIFNIEGFTDSKIVFVTEGEIDAMSVYEVSEGKAFCVGLGSVSMSLKFMDYVKANYNGQVFVLMLDNDEAGKNASDALEEKLKEASIPYIVADYEGKDPNESLIANRSKFKNVIFDALDEAEELKEDDGNEYNVGEMLEYFKTIETQENGFEAKTGFKQLDEKLAGGLHEGLIVLGAVSSLGKTTFTLQLADQLAGNGTDVIFFSLEMSKYELMAKSISRHSFMNEGRKKDSYGHWYAKDTVQILNNRRYTEYTRQEKEAIQRAIDSYGAQVKDNLFIYEGRYNRQRLTVEHIKEIVRNHVKSRKKKPVVIVDYLQIIAPTDPKEHDTKRIVDNCVFELKELSRRYKIPVITISSFNRDSYTDAVNMASFKESGAIEYSSDILIGLQFAGMEYREKNVSRDNETRTRLETKEERFHRLSEEEKARFQKKVNKDPIDIELKILKNRNGYQSMVPFRMINAFNYFEEFETTADGFEKWKGSTPFEETGSGNKQDIPIR